MVEAIKATHAGVALVLRTGLDAASVVAIRPKGWLPPDQLIKSGLHSNLVKAELLLPKGHIHEGEGEVEAALRELKEETGLYLGAPTMEYLGRSEFTYTHNSEHCIIAWYAVVARNIIRHLNAERIWTPASPQQFTFLDHRQIAALAIDWALRQ